MSTFLISHQPFSTEWSTGQMTPTSRLLLIPPKAIRGSRIPSPITSVNAYKSLSSSATYNEPAKSKGGVIARYEGFLERRYPRIYKVHRAVTNGSRMCFSDMKRCYCIKRDLRNGKRAVSDLSTEELVSFIQTNEEFSKLICIMVVAVLPVAFYVIAFAIEFWASTLRTAARRHYKPIVGNLKDCGGSLVVPMPLEDLGSAKIPSIEEFPISHISTLRTAARRHYKPIVANLKDCGDSLLVPMPLEDLGSVKIPSIEEFPISHIVRLCLVHRCSLLSGAKGLVGRAEVLRELDSRLRGQMHLVDEMEENELLMHLFIRRLQYEGKTKQEMCQLLKCWLVSTKDIASDISLLVHAPILCQADRIDGVRTV
uniref:LETM1 domain-containing protein n=1 Tax=Steinernema glaseri TaxID=37863 RepID=A0A1I7Z4U9_9BILA